MAELMRRTRLQKFRRRVELARKLRNDPGGTLRWCWWYAGWSMTVARVLAAMPPLTEAERFEMEVEMDLAFLPVTETV